MLIRKYFTEKKNFHEYVLSYIDGGDRSDYAKIINHIETNQMEKNKEEIRELFHLIVNIANNHHRDQIFFVKIEEFFQYFNISKIFSNSEIFNIFKTNKPILLYLFKNNILVPDIYVINNILNIKDSNSTKYRHYFYPEINPYLINTKKTKIEEEISKLYPDIFDNFVEKRKKAENHSYISELIRDDNIEEFVSYTTRYNLSLTSRIPRSLFETHSFLLKKSDTTLIEYSAFFGSIQIFKYLRMNKVKLTPSLWLYAIHGKNAEMIHLLEENHVEPEDKTFSDCLLESVKCHHNDIANYIIDNLLVSYRSVNDVVSHSFMTKYYNYSFFPNEFNEKDNSFFLNLVQYDYTATVDFILKKSHVQVDKNDVFQICNDNEVFEMAQIFLNNKVIDLYQFEDCYSVRQITIPSFITKIPECSFKRCSSLMQVEIPSSITLFGYDSFKSCKSLIYITIPSSVELIDDGCFYNCSSLASLQIPSSVKSIGKECFRDCFSLENMSIPSSVNKIGEYAFSKCANLKRVTISSSINSIERHLFSRCTSLKKVNIPS